MTEFHCPICGGETKIEEVFSSTDSSGLPADSGIEQMFSCTHEHNEGYWFAVVHGIIYSYHGGEWRPLKNLQPKPRKKGNFIGERILQV